MISRLKGYQQTLEFSIPILMLTDYVYILTEKGVRVYLWSSSSNSQVHAQNFSLGGGVDPEAIYNSCPILKIMP
jgi:hypothetical protein